ncbi:44585_t:CDS:2 [Gigaspora margarita]|uniref:44585_t:CDS:1 n=1 Tax=Gigaspora margarita TaxID=4874 RepID=A0ABN7UWH1_GIGMA|nr:44585_t:CDS:2 [Gigaspora margarita]
MANGGLLQWLIMGFFNAKGITTDLWFLHSDGPYIGIIARWIDSKNWSLKEALLICKKINKKHTDNNIKNALDKVIE